MRFVPEGGSLVEVTVRTFQSRFLLRSGPSLNEIVGGVLGRAQTLHLWFNRTQESAARKRGEDFDRLKYATEETFELTPLPCWAHLAPEDYRQRVAELVEAIESEARARVSARAEQSATACSEPAGT